MERHRLGIVIPALNEGVTIAGVVASIASEGIPIVVDDGSTDATAVRAQAAGATVVGHPSRRGYDAALNTGFACASSLNCAFVVTMDADGQHDPAMLKSFIHALEQGADVVVGIRDRQQRLAEHIFSWVGRIRWGILDPLCGMKAYRLKIYGELGHFDCYGSIGTELAIFAARTGRRLAQVPVKTRERNDSARFGNRYLANKRIMRALWLAFLHRH